MKYRYLVSYINTSSRIDKVEISSDKFLTRREIENKVVDLKRVMSIRQL